MIRRLRLSLSGLLPWTLASALAALPFSTRLCHAALIACVLCWVAEGEWARKWGAFRSSLALQALLALALLLGGGLFYTEQQTAGWFNLERKVFFFLIPVVVYTTGAIARPQLRRVFFIFVASCLAAAVACLIAAALAWQTYHNGLMPLDHPWLLDPNAASALAQSGAWFFFSYVPLASGIAMHPTYLGMYCVFCSIFLLHELAIERHGPRMKYALAFVAFFFMVFTGLLASRVVIIAMLILLVGGSLFYFSRKRVVRLALGSALVMTVLLAYFNPVSRQRNVEEIMTMPFAIQENRTYTTSAGIRASLWWLGWETWKDGNLVFGEGTGDVLQRIGETARRHRISNAINNFNPHNQYIYILVGNGLLAFAAFLLYLILPAIKAWQTGNFLTPGFVFLIGAVCMTETVLELQKGIDFFAVVQPALAAHWATKHSNSTELNLVSAKT